MSPPKVSIPSNRSLVTKAPDKVSRAMLQNCKDLIQHRIIGRYGNYIAKPSAPVTSEVTRSINADPSLIGLFHRYWKQIQLEIKQEQLFIQQQRAKGRMILCFQVPNIEAVRTAAQRLSFDEDELFFTIAHCAENREFRFSDLKDMMQRKHSPHRLARTIFEDLKYLDNELDKITGGIAYRLRPIIVGFKCTFFNVRSCDEDAPDWWSWNGNFLDVVLHGTPVVISQEEIEKARKRLRKEKRKIVRKLFGRSEARLLSRKKRKIAGV